MAKAKRYRFGKEWELKVFFFRYGFNSTKFDLIMARNRKDALKLFRKGHNG